MRALHKERTEMVPFLCHPSRLRIGLSHNNSTNNGKKGGLTEFLRNQKGFEAFMFNPGFYYKSHKVQPHLKSHFMLVGESKQFQGTLTEFPY